jgi:hypothetical protein
MDFVQYSNPRLETTELTLVPVLNLSLPSAFFFLQDGRTFFKLPNLSRYACKVYDVH